MKERISPFQPEIDGRLRTAQRRAQERHVPGEPLALDKPQVREVMDTETGRHWPVSAVMGTEYEKLIQLRMDVLTRIQNGDPIYRCSLCGVAVYICRSLGKPKFFFRHQHEDGSCPSRTRGELSRDEIDARKYNGAKESQLHRRMKDWVCQCLAVDGRFEEIAQEPTWKGPLTGTRRRPDVRAIYNGRPIAFEIQLSTTHLDVIAARRDFYMQEGGMLVWLFAEFDTEHRRMTEDDIFYNNNLNAFVVDPKTVEASLKAKEFRLECIWAQPARGGGHSGLFRRVVSFHELRLDPNSQRAYYFDYKEAKGQLEATLEAERQPLRDDFEAWMGAAGYHGSQASLQWAAFRKRFKRFEIDLPKHLGEFDRPLLTGLYSAKHNRPWGQKHKHLVAVAHRIANSEKHHLVWFMHAVREYGRSESMASEGQPGLWQRRYRELRSEYRKDPASFEPVRDLQGLVSFLFPELVPLPKAARG